MHVKNLIAIDEGIVGCMGNGIHNTDDKQQ